jgi:hypothetical protein
MRPELAKDDLGIDESTGLHVLVRIAQSPMPIHKDFVKDGSFSLNPCGNRPILSVS